MTVLALLIANAIAHIISFIQLRKAKSPNAIGVLVFAFINGVLAVLLWLGVTWSPWLILAFATIGAIGLLTTTIIPKKGTWIDYVILLLDMAIVGLTYFSFGMLGV